MREILSNTESWILSGILLSLFTLFATINFVFLLNQIRARFEYGPSLLPIFGGLFGLIGVLLMPIGEWTDRLLWCWLPLVLDAGCLPYITLGIYFSRKKI